MNIQDCVYQVEKQIHQRLPHYIDNLRALCAIDSSSYYKPGLDQVASFVGEHMRRIGMDVSVLENAEWGNDLVGVMRGRGHTNILLLGHIDTVYPVGIAASRPLQIEEDRIYGPGVCDMKGSILSTLYTLEALLGMGQDGFGELHFICVSDEEITTRHSKALLQQACARSHAALVLEAARPNGDIVSARKGVAGYTLTARGRSAHAGVEIEKGQNTIIEIAHQALQFQSLHGWREGVSINPGVIRGGTCPNVVPDHTEICFDMRYLYTEDRVATEKYWQTFLQRQKVPGIELTLEAAPDSLEPMVCTAESLKMACIAQKIAGMLGFSIDHVTTGGGSDANRVSTYGLPVLDGLGPIGGLDHSPDEYILKSSIAPRAALLAGMILCLSNQALQREEAEMFPIQSACFKEEDLPIRL